MSEQTPLDDIEKEQQQLDVLLQKGMTFKVPKSKLFALFSKKKEREFLILPPSVGVMDILSNEYIKLIINEEEYNEDPFVEERKLPMRMAKTVARIVAIAVLGELSFIPVLSYLITCRNSLLIKIFANYFYQKVNSNILYSIVTIIIKQTDTRSFLNSIVSISLNLTRTTKPVAPETIEKKV